MNRANFPGGTISWEDWSMNRLKRNPEEVRERAVRMMLEQQSEHESQWGTIQSVADKVGCYRLIR
jgi:transposase-like protein